MYKISINQLFIILIFVSISLHSFSQSGSWKVEQYTSAIIKVTYTPLQYKTGENVSDAVIINPMKSISIPYKIEDKKITVGLKNKVQVSYAESSDAFKGLSVTLSEKEKIYGGGERALPLNRRGYSFLLDNNPWYGYSNGADNLNFSVPFFTSSSGYGLFFDNPSIGRADIGKTEQNQMSITFSSGEINVYIIFGNDDKIILQQYHELTGKQGLPPRWAMGNFMSRFGYSSEEQVKEISSKMQAEKIPFDAVIFDLFWFGDSIKGTMGNLEWVNKKSWPNPSRMINQLKTQNIKTILITEPFVLQKSLNYSSSLPYQATDSLGKPFVLTDFYFGLGGLIDIFKKDARQWFWEKHDAQNKIGVDAWWGDLGEPEKHPKGMYHNLTDLGHKRLFRADEVHNIYGHYWTKMLYENYAIKYPDTRLFSLNRSGFAGSQRYNIIPWSGDVSRNWSGLQAQLPIMLGMSMSGIPYIHSDAGGFAGGEGDYELYVRWLQFSAFTPIFRPHGTALFDLDPAAYSFPSEPALMPSPYKEMAKQVVLLRYQMLPYNYTLAYHQAMEGQPLVAPLYYHFPEDAGADKVEDQFMWGQNILLAPVIQPSATERSVYLPKGNWYKMNFGSHADDTKYSGSIKERVNLNQILAYVKEGSFIPVIDKSGKTSEDYTTDSLTVHYYYSPEKSSSVFFDDDGKSKTSLKNKNFEIITFTADLGIDQLNINVVSNQGNFPGKPLMRFIRLKLHGTNGYSKATLTNSTSNEILNFDASNELQIVFEGKPITIVLQ